MNLLTASVFLSPSNKILLSPEKNDFGKYLSLPHILTTALRELNCSEETNFCATFYDEIYR